MGRHDELQPWSVAAVNLAEHADNAIHTDAGAQAAGFDGALVAGVTVYAYMTHVPMAAWGVEWLMRGGAEVRFRTPVLDRDIVDLVAPADRVVEARVGGETRATCAVTLEGQSPPGCTGVGDELTPLSFVADEHWCAYSMRAGDDLALYGDEHLVHPVSWMRIANQFFHEQIVNGPWIHVRSSLVHHGVATVGAAIDATAVVVDRFSSRAGERAILDVRIHADDQLVATYEHEAIVELAGR